MSWVPLVVWAQTAAALPPWWHLDDNIGAVATEPWTWGLLGTTAAATVALSATRADHDLRLLFGRDLDSTAWGDVALGAGYLAPLVVIPGLYLAGAAIQQNELISTASAALQSVAVACGAMGALKLVTGRPFPMHGESRDAPDRWSHPAYASEWNVGRPDRGLAWPSGHAACSFALASALASMQRDRPWVGVLGYSLATGIAVGMLVGDHHWTSDVLFGAALGQSVGFPIGSAFRRGTQAERGITWRVRPHASGAMMMLEWTL